MPEGSDADGPGGDTRQVTACQIADHGGCWRPYSEAEAGDAAAAVLHDCSSSRATAASLQSVYPPGAIWVSAPTPADQQGAADSATSSPHPPSRGGGSSATNGAGKEDVEASSPCSCRGRHQSSGRRPLPKHAPPTSSPAKEAASPFRSRERNTSLEKTSYAL